MNLVLFAPDEIAAPLPRRDPRARHLLEVLRRAPGEEFDAGLVNGPRGKGRIDAVHDDALALSFTWGAPPAPPDAITLLVGLPRPQTARDILRDATTLGVSAIHFVAAEKSEPSYAQSALWRDGEWRRHVLAGAEQAFSTQIPAVTATHPLAAALALVAPDATRAPTRLALDNYEAPRALSDCHPLRDKPLVLALGPERGWGARDRAQLRAAGFEFAHLGSRVLRLETAVVAALTLAKAARGTL
ncbi:MAG: 16S rRNA (uracil(1498)-N(3))-methyltransferase [Opitutae bacterium]|nr:16S rRNA (uracil(1498)-N(3))-methyltransferase [Opitutae bacterium]